MDMEVVPECHVQDSEADGIGNRIAGRIGNQTSVFREQLSVALQNDGDNKGDRTDEQHHQEVSIEEQGFSRVGQRCAQQPVKQQRGNCQQGKHNCPHLKYPIFLLGE